MKWECTVCSHTERARVRPELCGGCGALETFAPSANDTSSVFVAATEMRSSGEKRYRTGDKDFDTITGGIPEKSRLLVWGRGGTGKSRCALRWATHIGSTAVISLEMTEEECSRSAKESGARLSQMRISRDEQAPLPRVRCLVYDSISEAADPHAALERLKLWARDTGGIVFLICHATKDGNFRGPSTLQHWGEAELKIARAKEGQSRVKILKSRFCSTGSALVPLVRPHLV